MELCLYLGILGSTTMPVDDVREILEVAPVFPALVAGKHEIRGYDSKYSFLAYSQDAASRKVIQDVIGHPESTHEGIAALVESQDAACNLDSFNIVQGEDWMLYAVADGVSSEPESKQASTALTRKDTLHQLARHIRALYSIHMLPSLEDAVLSTRNTLRGAMVYHLPRQDAAYERVKILERAESPGVEEMRECVQQSLPAKFTDTEQYSGATFAFLYLQQLPRNEGVFAYMGRIGNSSAFGKIKSSHSIRGWYWLSGMDKRLPTAIEQRGATDYPHIISKNGSFLNVKGKIIRPGETSCLALATDDPFIANFCDKVARTPVCYDEVTHHFLEQLHQRRILWGERPEVGDTYVQDWVQMVDGNPIIIDDATALFVNVVA